MAGVGSSCGACKFLRRKCADGCVFAPYFSYDQGAIHFAAVHKVFGASNVSKLLLHLPVHRRSEAAATVSFEAQARIRDPVYGCVAYIFALQQQVARLQEEVASLTTHLSTFSIEVTGQPSPQTVDSLFHSFQLCMQKDYGNVCEVSPDSHKRTTNVDSETYNTEEHQEDNLKGELHPMYREAINRLEHSLLGDFFEDPVSLEELTPFGMLEDF